VASNTLEASAVANAPVVQMEEAPARVEPTPPVVTNNTETGSLAEQANVKVERKTQSSEVNAPAPVEASSDTLLDRADRTSDQADPLVAKLDNTSPEENQTAIAEDSAQNERTDSRNEREKWYLRDEAAGLAGDPSSGQPATGDTASDVKSEAPAEANTVSGNDLAAQMTAQLDPVQGPSAELPAIDPSLIAGALANAQTTLAVAPPAAVSSSNAISAANNSAGSTTAIGSGTSSLGTAGTRSPDAQRAERAADERSEAGSVRQLSQQERVRLVQRVARSFSRLGPEGGQITLKLHPPQLGSLNVTVRIEGQVMSARLQTETSAAREVLLENLPVLRERLQEQGVSIERFQVDVANDQAGSFGGQAQNPFPGDGNQGSQPARTDIDYRRLSRNSSRPGGFERMAANERVAPVWLPSESSLTLDIRA
jgi:flagellar hook-length control protein FliK